MGQGLFGSLESLCHGPCPVEAAGRTLESISERLKNASSVREEAAVEIDVAKEALDVLHGVRLR